MPATPKVTLAQVYAKLIEHDHQFEKIDARLGNHDREFEKIDARLGNHDRQFENLANLIFKLEDSLKIEIGRVIERIRQIETNLEKQTADIDTFRQEYFAVLSALQRIEKSIEEKDENTTKTFKSIFTRLHRVEAHLGFVEAE